MTRAGAVLVCALAACAHAAPVDAPVVPAPTAPTPRTPEVHHLQTDADLNPEPPRKRLAIDWTKVSIADDADALALWQQIAPTGDDWFLKLEEVPPPVAHSLALELLRAGNFSCVAGVAYRQCSAPLPPTDVPEPAPTSTFDDPCLRRVLALWAFARVEPADLPALHDALRAIASMPPPESELVAAVLETVPSDDIEMRYELIALARGAGQTEVTDRAIGELDEPHLTRAVKELHSPLALTILSPQASHAAYVAAITDDKMPADTRDQAMASLLEVSDPLPNDLRAALIAATRASDCDVAAHAARALVRRGSRKYAPTRPSSRREADLMRGICVLASYQQLQATDEKSLLASYLSARGLEQSKINESGDGSTPEPADADVVARDEAILPDVEEMASALKTCAGNVCTNGHEKFTFTWKPTGPGGTLQLSALLVEILPPCVESGGAGTRP